MDTIARQRRERCLLLYYSWATKLVSPDPPEAFNLKLSRIVSGRIKIARTQAGGRLFCPLAFANQVCKVSKYRAVYRSHELPHV